MTEKELLELGFTQEQIKTLKDKKLLIEPGTSLKDGDMPDFLKKIIEDASKERSTIYKNQLYDTIEKLKNDNKILSDELKKVTDFVSTKQTEEETARKAAEAEAEKKRAEELARAPIDEKLNDLSKKVEEKTGQIMSEAEKRIKELENKLHLESMKNHKLLLLGANPDPKVVDLLPSDEELLAYTKEDLDTHFKKASDLVKGIREETEAKLKEELKKNGVGEGGSTTSSKSDLLKDPGATMTNIFLGKSAVVRERNKYENMTLEELKEKSKELVSKLG